MSGKKHHDGKDGKSGGGGGGGRGSSMQSGSKPTPASAVAATGRPRASIMSANVREQQGSVTPRSELTSSIGGERSRGPSHQHRERYQPSIASRGTSSDITRNTGNNRRSSTNDATTTFPMTSSAVTTNVREPSDYIMYQHHPSQNSIAAGVAFPDLNRKISTGATEVREPPTSAMCVSGGRGGEGGTVDVDAERNAESGMKTDAELKAAIAFGDSSSPGRRNRGGSSRQQQRQQRGMAGSLLRVPKIGRNAKEEKETGTNNDDGKHRRSVSHPSTAAGGGGEIMSKKNTNTNQQHRRFQSESTPATDLIPTLDTLAPTMEGSDEVGGAEGGYYHPAFSLYNRQSAQRPGAFEVSADSGSVHTVRRPIGPPMRTTASVDVSHGMTRGIPSQIGVPNDDNDGMVPNNMGAEIADLSPHGRQRYSGGQSTGEGEYEDEPVRDSMTTRPSLSTTDKDYVPWYKIRWVQTVLAIVLLAAIAVAIAVPLSLSGDDDSNTDTDSADSTPQPATLEEVRSFLLDITPPDVLDAEGTPQNMALNWLVSQDGYVIDPNTSDALSILLLQQRYVVVVIYFAMDEEERLRANSDECTWDGVGCNADKNKLHIRDIVFAEEKLLPDGFMGEIPPELGFLTSLEKLQLSYKNITSLPMEDVLSRLISLKHITLSYNSIRGTLPRELEVFTNLEKLDLSNNDIAGTIPSGSYELTRLETVLLNDNTISGSLSSDISRLTSLRYLNMNSNELNGTIPREIMSLGVLEALDLSYNDLHGNLTQDFPIVRSLRALSLEHNDFTGQIPIEIGSLQLLAELWLGNNQLSSTLPSEIGLLAALSNLRIERGTLQGSIPTEIGNLSNLVWLHLSNNELSSNIPTELGKLVKLGELLLDFNGLNGAIPTELGALSDLVYLQLVGNQLDGGIPEQLCSLKNGELQLLTTPCTVNCSCCDRLSSC